MGIGLKADFVSHDVIITGLDIIRILKCRSGRMKIAIISQNMAEEHTSPNIDFPEGLDNRPDIYVEFTQEDARPVVDELELPVGNVEGLLSNNNNNGRLSPNYSTFTGGGPTSMSLVDPSHLHNMVQVFHISLNGKQSPKNIVTNIFIKKSLIINSIEHGVIPIKPFEGVLGKVAETVVYTKGCVWVKLNFLEHSILFANMHLPVDTSNAKTLGYAYRKRKFYKILNKLKDNVTPNTNIIVSGDLNFRREIEKNGSSINQLTELIKEDMPLNLKELPFSEKNAEKFTCKFLTPEKLEEKHYNMTNGDYKRCRETTIDKFNEAPNTHCFDVKRIPSRCDRFLLRDSDIREIKKLEYDSDVLVPEYDHNAIFASFEIGPPAVIGTQLGGRRRTRRRPRKSSRRS